MSILKTTQAPGIPFQIYTTSRGTLDCELGDEANPSTSIYNVDPGNSSAYQTIQAAIDAAAPFAATSNRGVLLNIRPNFLYAENLLVPAGRWVLYTPSMPYATTIEGTLEWNAAGGVDYAKLVLINLYKRGGNISGSNTAATGAQFLMLNSAVDDPIVFTTGAGPISVYAQGIGAMPEIGPANIDFVPTYCGPVDTEGVVSLQNVQLFGAITAVGNITLDSVLINTGASTDITTLNDEDDVIRLTNVSYQSGNGTAITYVMNDGTVEMDAASTANYLNAATQVNNATVVTRTSNGSLRIEGIDDSLAETNWFPVPSHVPAGLYRVDWFLRVTSPGDAGSTTVVNLVQGGVAEAMAAALDTDNTGEHRGSYVYDSEHGTPGISTTVTDAGEAMSYDLRAVLTLLGNSKPIAP